MDNNDLPIIAIPNSAFAIDLDIVTRNLVQEDKDSFENNQEVLDKYGIK